LPHSHFSLLNCTFSAITNLAIAKIDIKMEKLEKWGVK